MKKRFAFLVLLTGLSVFAFAQDFKGGIFGGINASRIQGDELSGFGKLGLHGGAFVERDIAFSLAWKLELKYSARGVYHYPTDSKPFFLIKHLNYMELPLSISYLYNEKVELELGIAPDVLLSERYEDESGILDPSTFPELRRFGLNGFTGISYYLTERISAGFRFTMSVIPAHSFEYYRPTYFTSGLFHNVISVGMKYHILK